MEYDFEEEAKKAAFRRREASESAAHANAAYREIVQAQAPLDRGPAFLALETARIWMMEACQQLAELCEARGVKP